MPAKPIAPAQGIAFAFPDVCKTPAPPAPPIPIPYPNIADLSQATKVATDLTVGGTPVLLEGSKVAVSSGDEAGSAGGVQSGTTKGECVITKASTTVFYGGKGVARFLDPTDQNKGNAKGMVLAAFPTVLVGD